MSKFALILEKLKIRSYLQDHLWSTLEIISRGQTPSNQIKEKKPFEKIRRLIWKNWSRLLIRRLSLRIFPKTNQNDANNDEIFEKKFKSLQINQEWFRKLFEALQTDSQWFSSHLKLSEAISKIQEISSKLNARCSQMVEILRCRHAAAQCLKLIICIRTWCEAPFKKNRCQNLP